MSSYRREPARVLRGLTMSQFLLGFFVLLGIAATATVPPTFAADADHLIISEILVQTRSPVSTFGSPFVEIVNPTGAAIDMGNVYLTDATTAPSTFYYNLTLSDPATANPGGGNGGDFHARFPVGYSLAAGDTVVISINGSAEFLEAYGIEPGFELFEDAMVPDAVPELVEVFPGSINAGSFGGGNIPGLSPVAESLILYTWDGSTDLVQDIDYLMWGTNTAVRFDKNGVTIGAGTYLADTAVDSQEPAGAAAPTFGSAFARLTADEGTETATGGNGLTGHDETSENLASTWGTTFGQDPGRGGVAFASAPVFTSVTTSPGNPSDGQAVTLSVILLSSSTITAVEFHYTIDGGAVQTVAGASQGGGVYMYQLAGQTENTVVTWYATAGNANSAAASWPAGAPLYTSSWTVSPAVIPGDGPTKLLLTEIATLGSDQEFIEIYNPSGEAVDLSDYYLTDANYRAGNQHYYRIAEGNPDDTTIGGGVFNDFHARFPDGYMIAAADTIVVTVAGSDLFETSFGFLPDLELFEDGSVPDNVPDMRWVFGDANNNSIAGGTVPSLTNGAETVILYHWDGLGDMVTDIDVFAWKDPNESTTVNHYFNKTGVTIGSHSYLNEMGTDDPTAYNVMNEFGNSYHRTDPNEGGQTPTGSNGVDGRDETSENFRNTFASMPYSPSLPGDLPDLEPEKLLVTQVCTTPTNGEFIEIHNPAGFSVNMGDYYLTDAIYGPGNTNYWRIAEGSPDASTIGGGVFNDFHARFPADYSIAAGDTITVAVAGSTAFQGVYGYLPDFELFEDDAAADEVPDMLWVFGDAASNSIVGDTNPGLTNSAETVILYSWQAGDDKVVDIDVFFWRDATSTSTDFLFDKSGITVGAHTYAADTPVAGQTPFGTELTDGQAYRRTDGSEGTQTPTGSNGVGGRDETSENFPGTFAMQAAEPAMPPLPPDPGDYPPKLLLTEITTLGSEQEFIEIHNPNAEVVDLSDYYLTDAIHNPFSQYYWRIAEGDLQQSTIGGGAFTDFHARFPDGYMLPAKGTIVVAVRGSEAFETSFGFLPDFELYEDGTAADAVPDMRYLFGDDTSNSIIDWTEPNESFRYPSLSNDGETVILYHYVDGEDRVVDIDVFAWHVPGAGSTSYFFNKTGQTIGSHAYLPELGTNESRSFVERPAFGNSYQRTDADEGGQTPTGSNGVLGADETSENYNSTFAILAYDPGNFTPGGGEGPGEGVGGIELKVPALTFLPREGEQFPIAFSSRPKAEAETKLRLFDMEGRVVLTIFDSQFENDPPGSLDDRRNPFFWDGRDATFELVRAGMYVLHLSVVDKKTGKEETKTAPVVVGTRLSN